MNRILFVLSIVLVCAANSNSQSQDPQAAFCSSSPDHRQFDFWVGEWDVFQGEQKVAESSIQRIIESCVIYENYSQRDGYSGKSFNFFDSHLGKWRQTWVDASGNVSEFSGELKENALQYEGESHYSDGTRALRRMTFVPLGEDRVRQSSMISRNNGETWQPHYELIYVRKK